MLILVLLHLGVSAVDIGFERERCSEHFYVFFSHVSGEAVLSAEILWALKVNVVDKNYSFTTSSQSSCGGKCSPDSAIAAKFVCDDRTSSYLATFGLAPHSSSILRARVKAAWPNGYVVLFDESLNQDLQAKQRTSTFDCGTLNAFLLVIVRPVSSDTQQRTLFRRN